MSKRNHKELCSAIREQVNENETETAFGEYQSWVYLQSGRSIEISHEEEGLQEGQQYYSVRLHCSGQEFDNEDFHATCGIIHTTALEEGGDLEGAVEEAVKIIEMYHESL